LQAKQFCNSKGGIELYKIKESEFEIEAGDFLFQHRLGQLILAIVENIFYKFQ
jgi:hypothetical protein